MASGVMNLCMRHTSRHWQFAAESLLHTVSFAVDIDNGTFARLPVRARKYARIRCSMQLVGDESICGHEATHSHQYTRVERHTALSFLHIV